MSESKINDIIQRSLGAYSFDRYGKRLWKASIKFLLDEGYDEASIQWILLSKHMRWAADSCEEDANKIPLRGIKKYFIKNREYIQRSLKEYKVVS